MNWLQRRSKPAGKSIIKPESKQAIDEIAKLLNSQATLKLHVVGHTDNVGTLPSNMTLSKQRAEAVVNALVDNRSMTGRDNHRVEALPHDRLRDLMKRFR